MRWLQPLYRRLSDRPDLLRALERDTGLRRADLSDDSVMNHTSFCDLIERLHAQGEPHICAWLALQFDPSVGFGQLYYLRSYTKLREMLAELMIYPPVIFPFGCFRFSVDWDEDSFEVRLKPYQTPSRLASRLLEEGALAWVQRIFDLSLTQHHAPLAVYSIASRPPCKEPLHALLGAPVQFSAPYSAMRYPAQLLDQTLPGGNPRIKHAIRGCYSALVCHSDAPTPISVQLLGCFLAPDGTRNVNLESMASRLGLGRSQLCSQLSAQGMRFSDIHNAHRRRLAFQLLVLEGAPVESVVRSLGYASRFAFERAFAKWFDTTPTVARKDRLQLGPAVIAEDWSDPAALMRMLPPAAHNAMDAHGLEDLQQPLSSLLQAYLLGFASRAKYGGKPLNHWQDLKRQIGVEHANQLIKGLLLQTGPGRTVADLEPLWQASTQALARLPSLHWFIELGAEAQQQAMQVVAWYEVGALLMYRMLGKPYGRLLRDAPFLPRALVLEQERQRFGLDRHTAGALLLSAWGLPSDAIRAQRAASQPVTTEAQRLAALYEPQRTNSSPMCSRTKRL
jgi:AraC-like DNA-binding protein